MNELDDVGKIRTGSFFLTHKEINVAEFARLMGFLAAYIRWKNAKNMQLMGISKEELRRFIEERDKKQITIGDIPEQESFRTPVINPDSLPDFKDWLK